MPTDNRKKGNCKPCSTNNCEKCYDTIEKDTCLSRYTSFVLTNENNSIAYSFEAIYYTDTNNKNIKLITGNSKYIKELVINNNRISSPSN